jgi:transcriptional regulator with XRE-family HTH domain
MADKRAGLGENPIRIIRKELKRNQRQFANDCGIHVSALYLIECGSYSHVFPSILSYLKIKGYDKKQIEKDYRDYIKHRREYERQNNSWDYTLDSLNILVNPFLSFRSKVDTSRANFCKRLCVQPALVYRLENGDFRSIPSSVEVALSDVGVPQIILAQLNEQIEEYYFGKSQTVQLA